MMQVIAVHSPKNYHSSIYHWPL